MFLKNQKQNYSFQNRIRSTILFCCFLFCGFTVFGQAPANDDFTNPIDLTGLINSCSTDAQFTTLNATPDLNAGSCWADGPNANVWFSFVATATGTIQVNLDRGNTKGDLRFAYMTLWDADCVTELSCSTYVDPHDDISLLYSGLTSGGTYHISVDRRYTSTNDDFTLCLSDQPTNDYLEGATNIDAYMNGCSADAEFSTLAGTRDRSAATCWPNVVGPGPYRNVWFEVTAPATGTIEVKLDRGGVKGMLRTAYMALWEADGTTEVACNSYRIGSDYDDISMLATGLTAGNSYYISVDNTYINEPDDFTLCLSDQPTNDYFEGATDITGIIGTCSANEAFSTLGATFDRNTGSCWPAQVEHNKWFSFTAPSTGRIEVNLDSGGAQGTLRHAYMSLWDADGTTELACTTHVNPDDDLSMQHTSLTPGNTYYISVDNRYVTTTETFALCLDPMLSYDFYEGAYDVTSLINSCSTDGQYTTAGATPDRNGGSEWNSPNAKSNRWFQFTAPANGQINITVDVGGVKGTQRYSQLALWEADGLTEIRSENWFDQFDDVNLGHAGLTPGATYYISVDTHALSSVGTFTLCLSDVLDYDFYEGALDITSFMNSCSPSAIYSTDGASHDRNMASEWTAGGPRNNRWFMFDAPATGEVKIRVRRGGANGDQRFTQLALWEADGVTELQSDRYYNQGDQVDVNYLGLTPGSRYYISVDSYAGQGSFTMCLNDRVDYDMYEGAINVTSYLNGSSPDAAFSSRGASPDRNAGSAWGAGGPRQNRWFYFMAPDARQLTMKVDIGGTMGTQTRTLMALWEQDGVTEVSSAVYSAAGDDVLIQASSLTPGQIYYISVTADTINYMGSFTLSLAIDNDGDGVGDSVDLDDDNDGILDSLENNCSRPNLVDGQNLGSNVDAIESSSLSVTPGIAYQFDSSGISTSGVLTGTAVDGPFAGEEINILLTNSNFGGVMLNGQTAVYNSDFTYYAAESARNTGNLMDKLYVYYAIVDVNLNGTYESGIDENLGRVDPLNDGIIPASSNTGTLYFYYNDSVFVDNLASITNYGIRLAYCDFDNDGIGNQFDLDSDGDGIPDNVEAQTTIGYIAPNADNAATYLANNGVNSAYLGGLTPTNTDGTDNPDYLDLDSDNEGGNDTVEAQITLSNTDSDNDGLDDSTDATVDYSDVGGTIDDPLSGSIILLDTDRDANSGGDVDFRDAQDDRLDTDNDGIADAIDLDDDNDGILDSEELNAIVGNTQPDCTGETILDFSTVPTLESGTALLQGAVYRFPNVTAGTDALVTIVETFNASVADIDNNAEEAQAFRPRTAFDISNVGKEGYIEYRMQFVTSGGTTPVMVPKFFININDTDGNVDYSEEIYVENPSHYIISNPTDLSVSYEFPWIVATGGTTEYTGAGNTNPQANFGINYENRSEIRFRAGITTIVPAVAASGREHNLDFRCTTNYVNPEIYILDSDGDGYPNPIDLDSDNDGILDVVEAGHNQTHALGRITGQVGIDGVPDNVQTDPDGGTVNYSIAESIEDVDLLPNYVDLDADGDGIPDNVEAQTTTGYNAPSGTIDGNGVDTNYVSGLTPTNTDGADTPDYLDTDSDNEGGDDTTEAGITLSGSDTDNDGLDDATDATVDYSDVGGTIDDPLTAPIILPDADNDATTGGDVDFRDGTDDRPDNDNDGIPDVVDLDDDNDGILDTDEGCGNLIINGSFEAQDFTDVAQFPGSNTDPWGTFIGAPQNTNQLYGWNYDQNIDGWVSRGTPPFFSGNTIADAYHGNQFIDVMGSNGPVGGINNTLTQTINTEIGQSYTFSFYWGEDIGFQSGWIVDLDVAVTDATNTVLLSEKLNYIAQGASATNIIGPKIWFRFERTFVATTSQTTVSFYATPTDAHSGAALDRVSVVSNGACRDTDNDGVIDAFDLDSDNDGIYDSVEIGHGQTQTNGRVDGSSGADGVPDVLQVRPYDEMVNYTAINSDSDGNLDFLDLDSDGDGIPDNVEAHTTAGYVSPNADDATTYLANNGVNSAYLGGLTPTNTDGTDNPDYLDTDSDNQGGDDTTEAGITLTGTDSDNDGLDDATDATVDYSDVGGTIDDPLTAPIILPDADNDATTGGDVDFRDATDDRPDNDNDGVPDDIDLDDDNDGIPDSEEDANNDGDNDPSTDPTDTDNDGVWDYIDLDSDNDGIPDNVEAQTTIGYIAPNGVVDANGFDTAYPTGIIPTNTDGVDNPDYLDTDSDNEGGNDTTEAGITLSGSDADNDGLDDATDATADYTDVGGTIDNPLTAPVILPDADADATTGGDVDFRDAIDDAPVDLDTDDDGILDSFEDLNTDGDNDPSTNPTNSDNDIYPDYLDIDSDNDGIPDNVEAQSTAGYIPPSLVDANDNGVDDAYETATEIGLIPVNTDGIDLPDYLDDDSDDDGVPDNIEAHDYNQDGVADVLFIGSDKDDDGLDDNYEGSEQIDIDVNDEINDPINDLPNTDGDLESDYRDMDDDNDGIPTMGEDMNGDMDYSNDDWDNDGIPDYLDPDIQSDDELEVYNVITPNGDGIHDVLTIRSIENYPNNDIKVFNRWGVLVFETTSYNNQNNNFDGRSRARVTVNNGELLPIGTYFYILNYEDRDGSMKQLSGHLYIN